MVIGLVVVSVADFADTMLTTSSTVFTYWRCFKNCKLHIQAYNPLLFQWACLGIVRNSLKMQSQISGGRSMNMVVPIFQVQEFSL
jgi:hypothetical protein